MEGDDDTFTSVNWDADSPNVHIPGTSLPRTPHRSSASTSGTSPNSGGVAGSSGSPHTAGALAGVDPVSLAKKAGRGNEAEEEYKRTPRWEGFLMVQVTEPRKEQEGTKEMFVSYGIRAETNLMHFERTRMTTRRRFQDFVFLREHLSKDFPACVVPPLPDKHRIGELKRSQIHIQKWMMLIKYPIVSRILHRRSL